MHTVILHCPSLRRDLKALREALPWWTMVHTGERTPNGEEGCLRGHLGIVRAARAAFYDCVMVVEDDCEFTAAYDSAHWQADAAWAQRSGFDVLCGGSTRTYNPRRTARSGVLEVDAFHSAHCLVYFESCYERVLANAKCPVDWSLGRDCGLRCAVVHPFVAVQRPSFSGILGQKVNYVPLYQAHERELAGVTA